jgi:hypothetical protein
MDPAILRLPADFREWMRSMKTWERLLGDSPILGSCPSEAQTALLAQWGDFQAVTAALAKTQFPLAYPDVLRIFESVRARLAIDPLPEGHDIDLDSIECDPAYVDDTLSAEVPAAMENHLARVAYQRERADRRAGVAVSRTSWASTPEDVTVSARLSVLLCVGPWWLVDGWSRRQPGNRSPKWILRAARAAVQARLRCHFASALMSAR